MRLIRRVSMLVVALSAGASTVHAQQPADSVMPRAGSWGAEAVFGPSVGANVLRFSSPDAAWLAGLVFNVAHQSEDRPLIQGEVDRSGWTAFADGRLGRRWWRGERGERIRPLTGLGVSGGVSEGLGIDSWNVGGYGELGATYFVSPHVSLGANSELAIVHLRETLALSGGDRITTRWIVRGNLVRVHGSVYF